MRAKLNTSVKRCTQLGAIKTAVVGLLMFQLVAGCANTATVDRADGTRITGSYVYDDDDIIVLKSARLRALRSEPAPWRDRRGRRRWVKREQEITIPKEEVFSFTNENRRAFKAGLAGTIITGASLIILVPSAIGLEDRNCGFSCGFAEFGTIFGASALTAGIITAVIGWAVYADTYRSESGPAGGGDMDPAPLLRF